MILTALVAVEKQPLAELRGLACSLGGAFPANLSG